MDSTTSPTNKEITMEIPDFFRLYNDGTIERLQNSPIVPPMLDDPAADGVSSKDVVISHDPSISARLYLPKIDHDHHNNNKLLPILVYFHGGGFYFESAFNQIYHTYFNLFVSKVHVLVVSVEYRLAPETPVPAAYDDCWEALKWVATNTDPWLINHGDFNRVFIGGDSAGGNIVHHIAMRAGAEALPGDVKVFGAILSHPFFLSSKPIGSEPVEGYEHTMPFATWDLVCPSAPGGYDNPMINPLANGVSGLATLGCSKILVCVAQKDSLRDRGVWYYDAVKKSGWQGELQLFEVEDEDHVFYAVNPESENAMKMHQRFADFLLQ
ncbi:hypothetical protein RIF29_13664 [Crotalaria pallida]|uniref:Alpha/beta hydrolase fold-3 domain-containing protein n=1 Tax=Crotalaria pallida TaxID=3830 RepID=A0AAN9IPM6_CROPI